MKALATLAFGAIALVGANFATAAPAAANNVGVYAGSNGFAIEVSNYRHRGYNHHNRGCWNRWYRRTHPYRCGRYYPGYYGHYYNNDYYYGGHRQHWRDRHHRRDRNRHHRRHGDRW